VKSSGLYFSRADAQKRVRGVYLFAVSWSHYTTKTARYRPVKSSRAQTRVRFHSIPEIRFEEQKLTSYSGLILFQALFDRLQLKERIRKAFAHRKAHAIFGHDVIFLCLIVHLVLGYRRLRDTDLYRTDPIVTRVLGLQQLPDVSTLSRSLADADERSVLATRELLRSGVLDRIDHEALARTTLDFDGSVISSRRYAQGLAMGFNRTRKGERSVYPLYCTVAQTGQFLDVHFRPGNVHDSNGAQEFMKHCFSAVRAQRPRTQIETRMDSAFFSQDVLFALDEQGVEFTASVPFERLAQLKAIVEARVHWSEIDPEWAYFEADYCPKKWPTGLRFLCVRHLVPERRQGPLQLDLFEPRDPRAEYSVIVTNKKEGAKAVIEFHHGRGTQEGLFGEAKSQAQLDYIPVRSEHGNRIYSLASLMAHNLTRELQMQCRDRERATEPKRPALWLFHSLRTIRNRFILRPGRLTRPQNTLTLSLHVDRDDQSTFTHFLKKILPKDA